MLCAYFFILNLLFISHAVQKFLLAEVSSDPLVRFGMKYPSTRSMNICSCLFSAYHAVKAKVRTGVINVQEEPMTSPTIRVTWSVFFLDIGPPPS